MFGFEKLEVWHKVVEYAGTIYGVTRTFPKGERFGLTSQLRRSSISVSSNIAEGSSRSSRIDFNRFIEIAYGSLLESVPELKIAQRQKFMPNTGFEATYKQAEELAKMLSGLRRTIKQSDKS
jgi:four helix bundle protein